VERIRMTDEMQRRVIRNCRTEAAQEREKQEMNQRRNFSWMKKTVAVAAVLSICVCCMAVAAATGKLGYFKDVVNWNGAVTGTEYVQADNEVDLRVLEPIVKEGTMLLEVELVFDRPDDAPFAYMEEVTLSEYRVVDGAGKDVVVITGDEAEGVTSAVDGGKTQLTLMLGSEEMFTDNAYTLVLESFYGLKKADSLLEVTGHWECGFEIQ